jgi:hypothetical protein
VENGELYLFEIYNKDFSENKLKGKFQNDEKRKNAKENLHTTYFKELFSKENLKNPIFKLSGEGEIFFRDRIEKYKERDQLKINKENEEKEVIKNHDGEIVKEHKRYTEKQVSLHLSIVLNNITDTEKDMTKTNVFNQSVNQYIRENNENVNIIGIDRGEKHLLYYSLMDSKGNILQEPKSLNKINGVDYQVKLDQVEKNRNEQRAS